MRLVYCPKDHFVFVDPGGVNALKECPQCFGSGGYSLRPLGDALEDTVVSVYRKVLRRETDEILANMSEIIRREIKNHLSDQTQTPTPGAPGAEGIPDDQPEPEEVQPDAGDWNRRPTLPG